MRATLLSDVTQVEPGGALRLGVQFRMARGWHISWKNPGEAGLPSEVVWDAPRVTVGALRLAGAGGPPQPGRRPSPATVTAARSCSSPPRAPSRTCKPSAHRGGHGARCWSARSSASRRASSSRACSSVGSAAGGPGRCSAPRRARGARSPEPRRPPDSGSPSGAPRPFVPGQPFEGELTVERADGSPEPLAAADAFIPERLPGIASVQGIALGPGRAPALGEGLDGRSRRARLDGRGGGAGERGRARGERRRSTCPAGLVAPCPRRRKRAPPRARSPGLPWMLLLAFLGGVLLNAMPCVFPVLALKAYGFARTVHADHGSVRRTPSRTPAASSPRCWSWPARCSGSARRATPWAGASSSRSRSSSRRSAAWCCVLRAQPARRLRASRCPAMAPAARRRGGPRATARCGAPARACSRWCSPRPARRRCWGRRWASPSPRGPVVLAVFAARGPGAGRALLRAGARAGARAAAAHAPAPGWSAPSSCSASRCSGTAVWLDAGSWARWPGWTGWCGCSRSWWWSASRPGRGAAWRRRPVLLGASLAGRRWCIGLGGPALRPWSRRAVASRATPGATEAVSRGARPGQAGARRLHRRVVPELQVQRAHRADLRGGAARPSPGTRTQLLVADWTRRDAAHRPDACRARPAPACPCTWSTPRRGRTSPEVLPGAAHRGLVVAALERAATGQGSVGLSSPR